MLGAVVAVHSVHILREGSHPHVRHENHDLHNALEHGSPAGDIHRLHHYIAALGKPGEQSGKRVHRLRWEQSLDSGKNIAWQQQEQEHRQCNTDNHSDRHYRASELVAELIVQPLLKLGLLLFAVVIHHAALVGGLHQTAIPLPELLHEIYASANDRAFIVPFFRLDVPVLHINGAVRKPDRHSALRDALHHYTLDQRLTSYRGLFCSILVFTAHQGRSFRSSA